MSHTSEVNNKQARRSVSASINFILIKQPSQSRRSSPTALLASFITQERTMPSRSSSIQPLVPHQFDHNPALSEPENYLSMLHGHFDMKKKIAF